jgi:hypothetical protein
MYAATGGDAYRTRWNNSVSNHFFSIRILIALCLLVTAATAAISLKPYLLKEAGFQFEVPEGWTIKASDKDGVSQHILTSNDESITVVFVVADDPAMAEKLWDTFREGLDDEMKNVKAKDHKENKHNGMEHLSEAGTADSNGKAMNWSLDIFVAEKPVVAFGAIDAKTVKKNTEVYGKLLQSMKRIS